MPGWRGDIVKTAIANQSDMELLDDVPDCARASLLVNDRSADVVVVGRELSESSDPDLALIRAAGDCAVLALAEDGAVFRYALRTSRTSLSDDVGGISQSRFIEAIREAADDCAQRGD